MQLLKERVTGTGGTSIQWAARDAPPRVGALWAEGLVLLTLLSLALSLRINRIDRESPWFDEIACLQDLPTADGLVAYLTDVRRRDPPMVPAYFTAVWVWSRSVGGSPLSLRFLSVALSMGASLILYRLARRMYGPLAALVAVGCFALSPRMIYYSQEIRVYSLVLLVSLGVAYSFDRVLTGDIRWLAVNLICNALLLWTHLLAALLVPVQGLALLLYLLMLRGRSPVPSALPVPTALCSVRSGYWLLMTWFAGVGILAVPWVWWIVSIDHAALGRAAGWIPPLSPTNALKTFAMTVGPIHLMPWRPGNPVTAWATVVVLLAAAAASVALLWSTWRDARATPADRARVVFLVAWWVLPTLGLVLISATVVKAMVPRYILHSGLALAILLGAGLSRIPRRGWRVVAVGVMTASLCALTGLRLGALPARTDWLSATTLINQSSAPGAPIFHPRRWVTWLEAEYHLPTPPYRCSPCASTAELFRSFLGSADGPGAWAVFGPEDLAERRQFEAMLEKSGAPVDRYAFPSEAGHMLVFRTVAPDPPRVPAPSPGEGQAPQPRSLPRVTGAGRGR